MVMTSAVAGIVVDVESGTYAAIRFDTPAWVDLIEWLAFHGIDARQIPAGTRVVRDATARAIRYTAVVLDDQGRTRFNPPGHPDFSELVTVPATEQGEAPPLPFPPTVAALLIEDHNREERR